MFEPGFESLSQKSNLYADFIAPKGPDLVLI
jgi:hypothetical protein